VIIRWTRPKIQRSCNWGRNLADRNRNPGAPFWSAGEICLPQSELGSLNPGLLGMASPPQGDIRSIYISATSGATVGVLPYIHEYRLRVLDGLDFAGLASVAGP
jgi:hypothetical protein